MFNTLKKHRNQKGFTLIELMIFIAIIGILAAIAIPQFSAYRERAFIASMKADCNSIRTGEEAYYVDNNAYTITQADLPGVPALSDGNTAVVALLGTTGYTVTVTSTLAPGTTIIYNSSTGQITSS